MSVQKRADVAGGFVKFKSAEDLCDKPIGDVCRDEIVEKPINGVAHGRFLPIITNPIAKAEMALQRDVRSCSSIVAVPVRGRIVHCFVEHADDPRCRLWTNPVLNCSQCKNRLAKPESQFRSDLEEEDVTLDKLGEAGCGLIIC